MIVVHHRQVFKIFIDFHENAYTTPRIRLYHRKGPQQAPPRFRPFRFSFFIYHILPSFREPDETLLSTQGLLNPTPFAFIAKKMH
jgi:hypothetical protein